MGVECFVVHQTKKILEYKTCASGDKEQVDYLDTEIEREREGPCHRYDGERKILAPPELLGVSSVEICQIPTDDTTDQDQKLE